MFGLFKKDKAKETATAETAPVTEKPEEQVAAAPAPEAKRDEPVSAPQMDEFVPPPGMSDGTPSGIPGFDYSPVDPNEEFSATGGAPLTEGTSPASYDDIIAVLQTVYDPEIPVNIYDLGLIYTCKIADNGNIDIEMTLTAPGCPVAGEMPGMVVRAVEEVDGAGEIEVTLVWEPGWTPDLMSEDAKLALGMG